MGKNNHLASSSLEIKKGKKEGKNPLVKVLINGFLLLCVLVLPSPLSQDCLHPFAQAKC
ncbi:hypothetical protein AAHH67_07890 [Niallia circulans]